MTTEPKTPEDVTLKYLSESYRELLAGDLPILRNEADARELLLAQVQVAPLVIVSVELVEQLQKLNDTLRTLALDLGAGTQPQR